MQQLRLFSLIFLPSPFGMVMTWVAAVIILLVANWSYTVNNSFLGDFLYGNGGVITKFSEPTDKLSVFAAAFSAQYITYEIIVFIFAMLIGFLVYLLLQSISGSIRNFNDIIDQLRGTSGTTKQDLELSVGLQGLIRVSAIFFWFCFWMLTLKILLPYAILATQLTVEDIFTSYDWLYALLGVVVLALTIHIHVVFARLTLLRPRLFGGSDEIELAILEK